MVKFSEYIKQKRTEAALTQDDLSELMEVSLNTVQNWESGRTSIKKERLSKLAEVLKVEYSELEAVFNDDGEDYPNFPFFMFSDKQIEIINTLRLTPEQKEFIMLLRIYNADNWDRARQKRLNWYDCIMLSLRKIPYKYTEVKGAFRVYELGLQVDKFFKYVPPSFCFEMIRANPDTDFDLRKLDKKDILRWMDLRIFNDSYNRTINSYSHGSGYYSYLSRTIAEFKEETVRTGYNDSYYSNLYSDTELFQVIYTESSRSKTYQLTDKGLKFKEWCNDLY